MPPVDPLDNIENRITPNSPIVWEHLVPMPKPTERRIEDDREDSPSKE